MRGKLSKSFILLLSFLVILCLPSHAQKIYYISNTGNSQNSGLSPDKPWSYLKEMQPGNTYLFKRGETFYCNINGIDNHSGKKIRLGSYGKGQKPVLTTYKHARKEYWERVNDHLWKIKLSDPKTFYGFTDPWNMNIGFLKVGNVIKGNRKSDLSLLSTQWDFFVDNRYLYVYSNRNPGIDDVKVAANYCLIRLCNSMELNDLKLEGTGGHAIQGSLVNDIKIIDVEINDIGGAYLEGYTKDGVRYGNGIEFWGGARNCIVKNCLISNVYDAAITMQGKGVDTYFENVTITGNSCSRNGQSFEFWVSGYRTGFKNCKFVNNLCYDAGYGWSYDVRPDKKVAVHILNYAYEVASNDLIIKNNVFSKAREGYMYISAKFQNNKKFYSDFNKIYLYKGQAVNAAESANQLEKKGVFVNRTSFDRASKFNIIGEK